MVLLIWFNVTYVENIARGISSINVHGNVHQMWVVTIQAKLSHKLCQVESVFVPIRQCQWPSPALQAWEVVFELLINCLFYGFCLEEYACRIKHSAVEKNSKTLKICFARTIVIWQHRRNKWTRLIQLFIFIQFSKRYWLINSNLTSLVIDTNDGNKTKT